MTCSCNNCRSNTIGSGSEDYLHAVTIELKRYEAQWLLEKLAEARASTDTFWHFHAIDRVCNSIRKRLGL